MKSGMRPFDFVRTANASICIALLATGEYSCLQRIWYISIEINRLPIESLLASTLDAPCSDFICRSAPFFFRLVSEIWSTRRVLKPISLTFKTTLQVECAGMELDSVRRKRCQWVSSGSYFHKHNSTIVIHFMCRRWPSQTEPTWQHKNKHQQKIKWKNKRPCVWDAFCVWCAVINNCWCVIRSLAGAMNRIKTMPSNQWNPIFRPLLGQPGVLGVAKWNISAYGHQRQDERAKKKSESILNWNATAIVTVAHKIPMILIIAQPTWTNIGTRAVRVRSSRCIWYFAQSSNGRKTHTRTLSERWLDSIFSAESITLFEAIASEYQRSDV